jgi:hypothetical protein
MPPGGTDPRADRDAVPLAVEAEHGRPAGRWMEESEQQPDQRALARSVGAQEAEHFALPDVERHVLQRADRAGPAAERRAGAVVLGQPLGRDDTHQPEATARGR